MPLLAVIAPFATSSLKSLYVVGFPSVNIITTLLLFLDADIPSITDLARFMPLSDLVEPAGSRLFTDFFRDCAPVLTSVSP